MKVKVLNANASTPFLELKVGDPFITTQAKLTGDIVDTVHIKVGDNEFTELGGDSSIWTVNKDTVTVRRVKIVSIDVELA